MNSTRLRSFIIPLSLAVLCFGSVMLIHPYADWSYGDDFAYAKPVQDYLRTGEMHYTDWSSMTLILQVWIGAQFCKVFGFSYNTLRLVSVLFECSAVLALYACARRCTSSTIMAVTTSLMLLVHPLFFEHALTFGTDVPFLGVILWALFYSLRFLEHERVPDVVASTILTMAAFFIRDVAIVFPAALLVALIVKRGWNLRSIMIGLVPCIAVLCCYIAWRWWLVHYHGLPKSIDFSRGRMLETLTHPTLMLRAYARNTVYTLSYLGCTLLPLTLILLSRWNMIVRPAYTALAIILGGSLCVVVLQSDVLLEQAAHQILNPFILMTPLENVYSLHSSSVPLVPLLIKQLLVFAGLLSSCMLIVAGARSATMRTAKHEMGTHRHYTARHVFLALSFGLYTMLMFSQWMLNRYYLVMVPLVLLLFVGTCLKSETTVSVRFWSVAALACSAYCALAAGHDLLAYQRANIQAYQFLEQEKGIDPHEIDGGFNYNAQRLYDASFHSQTGNNWWWVHTPRFVVLDGMTDSMSSVRSFDYTRWLPPGMQGTVHVLRNERVQP